MTLLDFVDVALKAGFHPIPPEAIANFYEENPDISESTPGKTILAGMDEYLVIQLDGGIVDVVGGWGGYEGAGDSMGMTLKWRDEYVTLTGYHNSWDTSYYDSVVEVFPEEKVIQIFKDKEGKEVDRHYN